MHEEPMWYSGMGGPVQRPLDRMATWFPLVGLFVLGAVVLARIDLRCLFVFSIVVLLGVVWVQWTGESRDVFSPLPPIIAFFVLSYFSQLVLLRTQSDVFSRLFVDESNRIIRYIDWIAAVSVVALGALALGVIAQSGSRQPGSVITASVEGEERASYRLLLSPRFVSMTVFGLALTGLYVLLAGGLSNVLFNLYNRTVFLAGKNYLASGPLVLFAVALGFFIVRGRRGIWISGCLFLVAMMLTFLTGSKANIAIQLGAIAIVFHYRIKAIAAPLLVAFMLSAVFALTFYHLYFRNALPRGVPLSQVFEETGGVTGVIQEFAGNTFFGAQALGVAKDQFPFPEGTQGFDVVSPVLLAPFPRGWLEEKPDAFAADFTRSFAPTLVDSGTTYPATAVGEYYIIGGIAGVVLGCFLMGSLLGFAFRTRFATPWALARYSIVLPLIPHYIRGEIYGITVLAATLLVPLWVLLRGRQFDMRRSP